MSIPPAPQGLEAVSDLQPPPSALQRRQFGTAGLRLTLRGRTIRLRGLRRPPTGALRWLAILGPGIVAGAAGNDGGAIASYSSAGAQFGYDLLWLIVILTVSLAVVQEMSARLGAATGRGLLDLIRERFGLSWALFAISIVLLANGGLIVSEFVGIGSGMELMGVSKYISVPLAAALVWFLVVVGSYNRVEKIFLIMTLVFFAYPVAAVLAHPHWNEVAKGVLMPKFHLSAGYITVFVGLIGTTLTPYQQLFQQSAVVEKGLARRHYGPERIDVYAGQVFSNLVAIFIIIATAATLHAHGKTAINTAADAAQALQPIAGNAAKTIFAVGLVGASLLSAAVLPLATAYSISEAFGFAKGVSLDFRRGRVFFGLFTFLLLFGAGVALIPNVPVITLLVGVQVFNGILLPVFLLFIMLLINDRRLTGNLKNTRLYNILGWGTFALVTIAVVVLLGAQALGLFGLQLFGGS
ncbi:MAG: Nramp family divalent metal transporter [Herpetosiphonaceae bacterium]|nr:Nramp family divalent metal transporter [Herpetosiphonaceae bacterium]